MQPSSPPGAPNNENHPPAYNPEVAPPVVAAPTFGLPQPQPGTAYPTYFDKTAVAAPVQQATPFSPQAAGFDGQTPPSFASYPYQQTGGAPLAASACMAPCPVQGSVYLQPGITVSPATMAVGRMLSKAAAFIMLGVFFCFPGVVLTAMGNSDHMSNWESDARWMKKVGPILLVIGIVMVVGGIVKYRRVKANYPEECKTLNVLSFIQQRNQMLQPNQTTIIQATPQQPVNVVHYPQGQMVQNFAPPPAYQIN